MKALLLIGGMATRLYPLSKHLPKSLLPICDRELLHYQITQLALAGINEIILAAGHLVDRLMQFVDGYSGGLEFKAIQIGGPSGGVIPSSLADTNVDYESVTKTGAIMGSGGLIVMDETSCMIDITKFFLNFTQEESCGKCTFCRIGTLRMLEILQRITEGNGREGDIELLEEAAHNVKSASLCALGSTAANPVLSTIRYFRDEYEAHIKNKECPAGVCKELISYSIVDDNCTSCQLCVKACPVVAITSQGKKKPVILDKEKCIKCGSCFDVCKFNAVEVGRGK